MLCRTQHPHLWYLVALWDLCGLFVVVPPVRENDVQLRLARQQNACLAPEPEKLRPYICEFFPKRALKIALGKLR